MGALILPNQFNQQPQQVTTVNSRFAPFQPQRLVNFALDQTDVVSGTKLARAGGGTFAKTAGASGIGLRFGDSAGANYISAPILAETNLSMTMVWVGQNASSTTPQIIRDNSGAGGSILIWNSGNTFGLRVGGTTFTSAGSWPNDVDQKIVVTVSASTVKLWANGILLINAGNSGGVALVSPWRLHRNGDPGANAQGVDATTRMWAVFAKPFPDSLALEVSMNPSVLFQAPPRWIWTAPAAGPDVTVALSGQAASALAGTAAPSAAVAITGSSAGATAGTLAPGATVALAGSNSTATAGIMAPGSSVALAGQVATGAQGSLGMVGDVTVALTGLVMTTALGQLSVSQAVGAGRPRRKFQVETSRGIVEVETLDEVVEVARAEKRTPKAKNVEVKLAGIKVSTPSLKSNLDYKAIEDRMRAQVQAEIDDEEELLLMML